MRSILILLRKDVAVFLRDKAAVALTFVVPVALIYVFGHVFGLNKKAAGPTNIPLAVANESDHPAAQRLVAALQAEKAFRVVTTHAAPDGIERPLVTSDLRPLIRENKFRFAVVIPRDVIREDAVGIRLTILSNPRNEIETQMVNGLLQRTIFTSAPELLGQSLQLQAKRVLGDERQQQFNRNIAEAIAGSFGGDPDAIARRIAAGDFGLTESDHAASAGTAPGADSSRGALAGLVKIDAEQVVGKDVKSPAATRVVGGWAMMFLLFALSASAAAFFEEKKTGIFQRLLSAPVRRAHILWSRFLMGVGLGLVQLVALFVAGWLMYGIDVFGNLANLIVICLAAAAACTSFGMFLAAVAPTAAAANGLATFLILAMSACGGAWFPVTLMPEFMQELAKFTLVYWAMEGFAQVLWVGNTFVEILPTVGILLGIAAGVMAVALWRFERGRLFE